MDPESIRQAERDEKLTLEADELCRRVKEVFSGVTLGDGVGLFEGQAIDDYETDEVRREKRESDEVESWDQIKAEGLNRCYSSLCFFDAAGMRFHLPAFLIADLNGDYEMGMEFTLTHLSDYTKSQFALLNRDQRRVVREYLQFLLNDPDSEFHYAEIDGALSGYWTEDS